MKQKQINKVIELWRESKQQAIGYDANGREKWHTTKPCKRKLYRKIRKDKI